MAFLEWRKIGAGAAYAEYQLRPKTFLAARGEYLSDHGSFFTGGLFSGVTEELKEATLTYACNVRRIAGEDRVAAGLVEQTIFFLTGTRNVLSKDQTSPRSV